MFQQGNMHPVSQIPAYICYCLCASANFQSDTRHYPALSLTHKGSPL